MGLFSDTNDQIKRQMTPQFSTGGVDPIMGGQLSFEQQVVRKLVEERGEPEAAARAYPSVYKAMYGGGESGGQEQETQQAQPPSAPTFDQYRGTTQSNTQPTIQQDGSGQVSVYDASTGGYRTISIGKRAATYNDDAFDLSKVNFDTSAMVRSDTDQQWADSLRVDYSKLGGLNGGKSNNAYNMYSNTDLLPNLFAWRLGLRPAEVNALDLHTRREVATKLLSDYYDSAGDELRSRIGDKGAWTNTLLRAYGMEDTNTNNGYKTGGDNLEHLWNFGKSVFKGAGDAVSNYEAAATAILGDGKYEDGDLGKDLAGWLQSVDQANQSETGQYLQQRLEQLMREERYLDAATHILTHGDLLAAYGGTMLGSAFMDGLVAKGLITAGGLVLSPFTGGTSAAAAAGYNLASTASSLAQKLAKLGKVSTLAAVSGMNMTGGVAKEIMLTGNEIPKGSDVHKALIAYGLIGGALSGLPGTVERQIFDRIMASPAGKNLTEQAGMATAKSIREALEKAGYRFTEKGIVKPLARKAIDWTAKPLAKGAMEGATEYVQESGGSIIRQGAGQDGSFDDSKVDFAQVHVDGMTGAILGTALGTGGGLLSQTGASRRDSRLVQAYEPAKQAEATQRAEQRAFQDFVRENIAMANDVAANAWRYNTDGTLKTEEEQNAVSWIEVEAYIAGDVSALTPEQRQHRVNVVSAVLRTEFDAKRKADEENAKTRTQDEDISMAGFDVPQDIVVDTNVAQQIRDEYTRRNANLEANIRRTNVGDMYVAPDVMKDVPNVTDSDRKALSRIISSIKATVDKERKAIEKEQAKVDEKYRVPLPEQLRSSEVGQRMLAEEQQLRSDLDIRRAKVDEMDMAHANSHSPAGVTELLAKAELDDWVPNQRDNVVRLSAIMADAVANAGYEPGSKHTRFNRAERQAVIDSLIELVGATENNQMANTIRSDVSDLSSAISTTRKALSSGAYAGSSDTVRRLAQLDMLETIVEKDMPEMLGNWRANKDKKTKGMKPLVDGWNGDNVAYTNAVDSISRTLGWGKFKNTEGKAELARGGETAKTWASLVNDGKLRANPVAALQELYDSLAYELDSAVLRDGATVDEVRAFNERKETINGLMSEVAGYQYAAKTGKSFLPVKVVPNSNRAGTGFTHRDMAAVPAQYRNKTGDYLERIAEKLGYVGYGKDVYYADPQTYLARYKQQITTENAFGAEVQSKAKRRKNPLIAGLESNKGSEVENKIRSQLPEYLDKVIRMITDYNANAGNPDFVFDPDWDGELSSDAEIEKYIRGAEAAKEATEKDKEVKQKGKKRGDEADAKAKEVMETEVPINPPPEPQKSKITKKDPLAGTETSTKSIHAQMVESLVSGTRVVSNMRIVSGNAVRDMLNKAKEHATEGDGGITGYFRNFVTAVKATNPDDVVLHRTLDVLADKFDQQDKIDAFLERSLDDKKRQTKLGKDTLREVNNQIFHRMLEASGTIEAGDIKDLMDLVAASEQHDGYKLFYAQLNETAVANNVAIEYVKDNHPSGKDIAAMWFPAENKVRIYGAKSQQDVATSLLHEYMHVAFSKKHLNGTPLPILADLESRLKDNKSPVYAAAVRVEQLALKDDSLRNELQVAGILGSDGKIGVGGMEEFIVTYMTGPNHRDFVNAEDKISGLFNHIMREAANAQNPNGPDKLIPKNQRLVKDTHFGIGELAYDQTPKARTRVSKRIDPFTGERIKPNESDPKDRTTAVTFGFSEDNPNVGSLATAWYNAGGGWTFFYYDKNDTAHRIDGLDHAGVMKSAQDLGLWIDQVQKDVLMNTAPTKANEYYDRNAAGTRKLLRLINRATGGTDEKISAPIRWITRAFQSVAVNQSGLDHWFAFYENALFNTTGKDMRGKIQTEINRIKTYTSAQLYRPGVGGNKSIYDLKNDLVRYMKSTGWSEAKINKTMYAMMAGKRHYDIMTRQKTDPRWKGMPMDSNANVTGFKLDDGTPDPTGEKYLATLSIEERRTADELAKLVTSLNDSVLDFEHQAGRISDAQYEQMRGQFYVPLRNDTDEATAFQRMAIGRHSYADDPLSHLLANHEARVIAAERSSIYQAFMDMVEANPIPGFVTFNSSTLKNKGDGEYAMTADGFIEGNSITFYRNGEKVRMTVADQVVAKAMKNAGEQATSAYFDTLSKVTGYMGLVRTSLPTFAKTAWFRDATMVLTNIQAAFRGKEDFSDLEWMALSGAVFRDMARYIPIMVNGRRNPENADFRYKVYRTEGGIGNTSAFSIDAVKKSLEVNVFESGSVKSTIKRKFDGYLDLIHVSDDAARFSLWMNYLEKKHGGKFASEADLLKYLKDNPEIADRARDASKNITGNFEQRGVSRGMRSHFVFWNAIMKGIQNVYGMLNPRYGTYGMKSLGFLAAYIMMSGSDEEDEDGKLKESRMKNMGNVITIGGTDFPVAQELRGVIHLAQAFKYGVFRDDWSWEKTVKHVSDGIIQSVGMFTPAETDDALTNAVYAFTPTIAQPITLQVLGKTFFGSDIAPDPYDSDGKKWTDAPDYLRGTANTSDIANGFAEKLFHLTSGTLDVAPNSVDMWLQQLLGSVWSNYRNVDKEMSKGASFPEAFGKLFTRSHEHVYNVYALRDEWDDRIKAAKQSLRLPESGTMIGGEKTLPPEYHNLKALETALSNELKSTGDETGAVLSDLYKQLRAVRASDSPSPDEVTRIAYQIEQLTNKRNVVYGKYLRELSRWGY